MTEKMRLPFTINACMKITNTNFGLNIFNLKSIKLITLKPLKAIRCPVVLIIQIVFICSYYVFFSNTYNNVLRTLMNIKCLQWWFFFVAKRRIHSFVTFMCVMCSPWSGGVGSRGTRVSYRLHGIFLFILLVVRVLAWRFKQNVQKNHSSLI